MADVEPTKDENLQTEHTSTHDVELTPLTLFKYTYSTGLLIFSLVIVMALIAGSNTALSDTVHPALAYVVLWTALIWLTMIEGSQASLVGLPPVDRELYRESHPISYKCTGLSQKGDNLDRYLMGRQFMVLLVVFLINFSGAPLPDSEVLGMPKIIIDIFLGSGLAMILFTCMIGQLATQVNASHCMLDFLNTNFAWFTLCTAMVIEFSGIMHASYLIQNILSYTSGKPIVTNEGPRDGGQALFFWGRVLMSCVILCFCLAITFTALFEGKTTMWDGVPEVLSLIMFFLLLSVVGMLEGMQIAFFAVAKLPADERGASVFAKRTCELLFKGNGQNLPGFMVGRQLCVVSCFFIIARVTTLNVEVGTGENILGLSDGAQEFLNTGLHAAVITTIIGSISWQLAASAFPIAFLSTPITYILLVICLFLEFTGIASGAWVLADILKRTLNYQYDEVYIGTPEERVARAHGDVEAEPEKEALHLSAGSAFPAAGADPVGTHKPVIPEGIDQTESMDNEFEA